MPLDRLTRPRVEGGPGEGDAPVGELRLDRFGVY
jgi:hypothetical protein